MDFTFRPDNGYFMPVSFGPAPELFKTLAYKEILGIEVSFLTDKDALAARLPAPFEPTDQPMVTIYYYMTKGCEFLAWRPYNKRYCHGVFRWLMESGGGQIRDRGAHVMSCAKYWMNADDQSPAEVEATGTPPEIGLLIRLGAPM